MQTTPPPPATQPAPRLTIDTGFFGSFWLPRLEKQQAACEHFSHTAPEGVPDGYYDEAYLALKILVQVSVASILKRGGILLIHNDKSAGAA